MNIFQKQLAGLQHKQQLLGILVFSLVTVVVWVSISLLTSQTKSSISPALVKIAKPLTPTLNTAVIETLEKKRVYNESELSEFPIFQTAAGERRVTPPAPALNQLNTLSSVELASPAATTPEAALPATVETATPAATPSL